MGNCGIYWTQRRRKESNCGHCLTISDFVCIGVYNLVQFVIDSYQKIMEEILQYIDNEKDILLNDIVNAIKDLLLLN